MIFSQTIIFTPNTIKMQNTNNSNEFINFEDAISKRHIKYYEYNNTIILAIYKKLVLEDLE